MNIIYKHGGSIRHLKTKLYAYEKDLFYFNYADVNYIGRS
jgi:hypothetical protein